MKLLYEAISMTSRILGFTYFYNPSHNSEIIEYFTENIWLEEWPYGTVNEKKEINVFFNQKNFENESIEQAYKRLFVGPELLAAPPWGSVYLDQENVLFGWSTIELRNWMHENNIENLLLCSEPEDHFGLMLMLVSWVAENNPNKLNELLNEHLLPWGSRYLEKLFACSDFPFYEGIAILTKLTLKSWQEDLNLQPAKKELFF
ncbi:Tat proofreading chaperone DmsD [Pectobacterium sp. A5351]|uniref:Tat proofreading chaperone DmsD n=1 Tax=Pectobacterium sp. A5351 TaxID=2914983 RepID=UPI00232BDBDF|nr:Tat proofreading chaperone DmsD [Pectobacterium sp. A5351]WCG84644.1 Tat proofreading chaperone DmsD [Pectobacterium sp. A5351]